MAPSLAYVLLRAPVEERYRAHSLLDITDLQLRPIHACLLAHQLSNTLPLFFLAQVSREIASYFVSYLTSYFTRTEAVRNARESSFQRLYEKSAKMANRCSTRRKKWLKESTFDVSRYRRPTIEGRPPYPFSYSLFTPPERSRTSAT